jgi:cysteine desulfurase
MASAGRIYLDHNAGAPLRPEARDAMIEALAATGNASSVHAEGRKAHHRIERARSKVAELAGADPRGVTFTSGGSEANNTVLAPAIVIAGKPTRVDRLFAGATEHPSVLAGGRFDGDRVDQLPVDAEGLVDLETLDERLAAAAERGETTMVSVMLANNETGTIQPVAEIAARAHAYGAFVHSDAAQAAGRLPIDIEALGVDFLTLSGHKIGGPQGAGAIVMRSRDTAFTPLIAGGGQEHRRRAGTENVAAIAGFGAAAEAAAGDLATIDRWRGWRDGLAAGVADFAPATIFSGNAERLPQTVCFGIAGLSAETLVIGLDLDGIAVSSGSACSSGKVGPSHVLAAMGVATETARSAIRVSFGWDTEEKDLDTFQIVLRRVVERVWASGGEKAA